MQARERAAKPRDALFARGARPAGGGEAADHLSGAGPIVGANRAPARPAIPKPCRFTGLGQQPPSMT